MTAHGRQRNYNSNVGLAGPDKKPEFINRVNER